MFGLGPSKLQVFDSQAVWASSVAFAARFLWVRQLDRRLSFNLRLKGKSGLVLAARQFDISVRGLCLVLGRPDRGELGKFVFSTRSFVRQ